MSSSNLTRWSGLAASIGGVLFIISDVAQFVIFGNQPESSAAATDTWIMLDMLMLASIVLIILGLVGLYTTQARRGRVFGLIAFLVAMIGTVMLFGFVWTGTFVLSYMADAAPEYVDPGFLDADPSGALIMGVLLTFVLFAMGWLLFGLASLQARVLPRGASILLIIGAVLFFVLFMLELPGPTVVFCAALAWMGYALWSSTGETVAELNPAHNPGWRGGKETEHEPAV
jgi:hypothetical protein